MEPSIESYHKNGCHAKRWVRNHENAEVPNPKTDASKTLSLNSKPVAPVVVRPSSEIHLRIFTKARIGALNLKLGVLQTWDSGPEGSFGAEDMQGPAWPQPCASASMAFIGSWESGECVGACHVQNAPDKACPAWFQLMDTRAPASNRDVPN